MPEKFQAIKIHEDGRLEVLTWDEGPLDLDALRRHIGCEWVDAVHPHPASMERLCLLAR
jgi:anti-sigma regulatory factor (Ser/Thr protein kinase)